MRSNITEDRQGMPLTLRIAVVDVASCEPAVGVYVDVWHADAMGEYSAFDMKHMPKPPGGGEGDGPSGGDREGSPGGDRGGSPKKHHDKLPSNGDSKPPKKEHNKPPKKDHNKPPKKDHDGAPPHDAPPSHEAPPTNNPNESSRWLRGVVRTDALGFANFTTIMPSYYNGRSTHIHVRVHTSNVTLSPSGALLGDGRIAHTGQLFFADELVVRLSETVEPYAMHAKGLPVILNGDDGLFLHDGGVEQVVSVQEDGTVWIGDVTVGVDLKADHPRGGRDGPRGGEWGRVGGAAVALVGVLVCAGGVWMLMRFFKRRAIGRRHDESGVVMGVSQPYHDEE